MTMCTVLNLSQQPATPTLLNERYLLGPTIGQGGMGAVYRCRDMLLGGRKVAIKQMRLHQLSPDERLQAAEQFRQEALMLAECEHPGLVPVTDFFEDNGTWYLVMGLVEGETLSEHLLRRGEPVEVATAVGWMLQLCNVLEYLHSRPQPIIFRDLKPDNVMLDSCGHLRLIDFGIARVKTSQTATLIKGAGSPGFCPLEQYGRGNTTAHRADIYGLGATFYYVLTGQIPTPAIERAVEGRPLLPPSAFNKAISPSLDRIVLRMLALAREDRYGCMAEVREALSATPASVSFRTIDLSAINVPIRRRQRWQSAALIAASILLLVSTLAILSPRSTAAPVTAKAGFSQAQAADRPDQADRHFTARPSKSATR